MHIHDTRAITQYERYMHYMSDEDLRYYKDCILDNKIPNFSEEQVNVWHTQMEADYANN